jgi:hypothetical protein
MSMFNNFFNSLRNGPNNNMSNKYGPQYYESIYNLGLNGLRSKFPLVGDGTTRLVFGIDNYLVAKASINKEGIDQCSVEDKVFRQSGELRRYLCPLVWYKKGLIIMRRALPLEGIASGEYINLKKIGGERTYRDLVYLSKKFDLNFKDIISISSWGLLDGRPVLFDYGEKN